MVGSNAEGEAVVAEDLFFFHDGFYYLLVSLYVYASYILNLVLANLAAVMSDLEFASVNVKPRYIDGVYPSP
jgi:hypothetical protein